jgi:hypothetical protein
MKTGLRNIFIHSVPRSGSSWLGQIFNSSPVTAFRFQPLFSHAYRDRITARSSKSDIKNFMLELYRSTDEFVLQSKNISGNSMPAFGKTTADYLVWKEVRYHHLLPHLMQSLDDAIVVALVRHPCGVLNSWQRAPREFLPSWSFPDEWRFAKKKNRGLPEEYYGFEKWKECTRLFERLEAEYSNRVFKVRYESLLQEPVGVVGRLFDDIGLPFEEQTIEFLRESRSHNDSDPYGVYRDNDAEVSWRDNLPDEIAEIVVNECLLEGFEPYLKS